MNKLPLYIVCLFLFKGITTSCQQDPELVIEFNNLKYNKASYLSNNLNFSSRENISEQEYKNNLEILPSILKANVQKKGDTLLIKVDERITAYPFIDFGMQRDEFWFALGGGTLNGFKQGHQFFGAYQYLFGQHNANLYYNVPRWSKYKFGNNIAYTRFGSIEPLFFDETEINYTYLIHNIDGGVSYLFNNHHSIGINTNYFTEQYKKIGLEVALGAKNELFEQKGGIKLQYTYIKQQYVNYLPTGWRNKVELQAIKSFTFNTDFNSFRNELIYNKAFTKNVHLALRNILAGASNNDSPFAPFAIDSYLNVRGVGYRNARATALALLNVELRYVLPSFLKNFQSQLTIFNDQVSWREPGGELNNLIRGKNYVNYSGLGIRISYLKGYNYTFRLDYGINTNEPNEGGFVIGVGQFF